jgi:hypothetical protein
MNAITTPVSCSCLTCLFRISHCLVHKAPRRVCSLVLSQYYDMHSVILLILHCEHTTVGLVHNSFDQVRNALSQLLPKYAPVQQYGGCNHSKFLLTGGDHAQTFVHGKLARSPPLSSTGYLAHGQGSICVCTEMCIAMTSKHPGGTAACMSCGRRGLHGLTLASCGRRQLCMTQHSHTMCCKFCVKPCT